MLIWEETVFQMLWHNFPNRFKSEQIYYSRLKNGKDLPVSVNKNNVLVSPFQYERTNARLQFFLVLSLSILLNHSTLTTDILGICTELGQCVPNFFS